METQRLAELARAAKPALVTTSQARRVQASLPAVWNDFHTAANPTAILALCAEVERLEKELERLKEMKMPCDECAQWKEEAGKLRAALREADADLRLGGYCRLCSKKADQGIPHGYKCPFALLKENDRG